MKGATKSRMRPFPWGRLTDARLVTSAEPSPAATGAQPARAPVVAQPSLGAVPGVARVAPGATKGGIDLVNANGVQVARAFLPYVQALRTAAARMGASFRLTSGYRSPAEQNALLVRWQAGDPSVIARPAENSLHLLGLAIDVESNQLAALGKVAESMGLRWGGRFGDPVHFDLGRR